MNKRIVCVLLTLIMLVSLVPAGAITASAAGNSVSEPAITVLKQLEGYNTTCAGTGKVFGYGTVCTDTTPGAHNHKEEVADAVLRKELDVLDAAVNSFASSKGLSLTQGQHDALVLFSFENGTAWTTGTGDFQFAIANRKTGSEFLNAICYWHQTKDDDNRRKIEANMYLYGKYASVAPDYFITVTYSPEGGSVDQPNMYTDIYADPAVTLVPERENWVFMGWYDKAAGGVQVTKLTSAQNGKTLYAMWQHNSMDAESANTASHVNYEIKLASVVYPVLYRVPSGKAVDIMTTENLYNLMAAQKKDTLIIQKEYIDANGIRWGRISLEDFANGTQYLRWIRLGAANTGAATNAAQTGMEMDVTVTVTNSYVRSRVNASIHSQQNGTYNQGAKLRIINTANANGFLWGQVAKSADDATPIGWVALMYTNFESVRNDSAPVLSTNVIARARITFNGYVNVRKDAGTDHQIVGALPQNLEVDLYETKYVNGIQWGRCNTGWFCLSYADVTRLVEDNSYATDVGFTSYAFTGDLKAVTDVYKAAGSTEYATIEATFTGKDVTVTNLTQVGGELWGKIAEGWVKISNVTLDPAKFYVVAETVTVRDSASSSGKRVDTLVKGVEFDVTQIVMAEDTIWGYADKVGEGNKTYAGWINLATKYVSRNGAPTISTGSGSTGSTGLIATVVGTDSVRVRETGATYGRILGSLSRGTTAAVLGEIDGWYKLDIDVDGNPETDSWVVGTYLDVREGTAGGSTATGGTTTGGTVETGLGVVANTYSGVNVRNGAGTAYAQVGKMLPGTTVEILEVTTVGASKWGRTAQGWICMDYVTMVSRYPVAGSTGSTGSTGSGSTVTGSETAIYTGTIAAASVNIRKDTSLDSDIVRTVTSGDPITVHEILTVVVYEEKVVGDTDNNAGATVTTEKKTQYWARVNDGYIYNPGDHLALDTLDEATYTVTEVDTLNVRETPEGTLKEIKLKKGDQVKITKLQIVKGSVWGYAEFKGGEGWISLAYTTKGAIAIQTEPEETTPPATTPTIGSTGSTGAGGFVGNATGYRYTGKVIRNGATPLKVRATPSTGATVTATLNNGAALVIYETVQSEGMAWGRCDAGWVYLYYVDLTPCVNGAIDAFVVANENTIAYTDYNCSAVAGTYARQSVVDVYEIVGKMARTDLGWVHTDNLM